MKNSRYFKVQTVEQFKVLKYININFEDGALELHLIRDNAILAEDCNGERIIFYYDAELGKVQTAEPRTRAKESEE